MNAKKTLSMTLAAAMAAGLLAGCGGSSSTAASSTSTSTESKAESTAASTEATTDAAGKVYYLNFKPEQDEAWQNLAKKYTEETGVPVTVVTAASGQYETTLMSEMAHPVPGQRPCRSGQLEGLLLRPERDQDRRRFDQ